MMEVKEQKVALISRGFEAARKWRIIKRSVCPTKTLARGGGVQ